MGCGGRRLRMFITGPIGGKKSALHRWEREHTASPPGLHRDQARAACASADMRQSSTITILISALLVAVLPAAHGIRCYTNNNNDIRALPQNSTTTVDCSDNMQCATVEFTENSLYFNRGCRFNDTLLPLRDNDGDQVGTTRVSSGVCNCALLCVPLWVGSEGSHRGSRWDRATRGEWSVIPPEQAPATVTVGETIVSVCRDDLCNRECAFDSGAWLRPSRALAATALLLLSLAHSTWLL